MNNKKSLELYKSAEKLMPGGVNSPVRAFKSVDLSPLFIKAGQGSKIFDEDDNEYIDYVSSWGPLILGHRHPRVIEALENCLHSIGLGFGAPTELENKIAELIIEAVPSIEMVRLVTSGTEATMSALRLARGYTGRNKIIKFEGCYHGHVDNLLIKAGSGAATFGVPNSPGVTEAVAAGTIIAPFNDLAAVEACLAEEGQDIAAIIVEPIAGNMGCVPPQADFLKGLRRLASEYGVVLIFDEVMTGFRVSFGGAQELYGVTPDLTCLGKIIGGGLPVGAYGGKKEIMEQISPIGPVYQAGTLAGNPVAVTAGITTLQILKDKQIYAELAKKTEYLGSGLSKAAEDLGIKVKINTVGSMFTMFFTDEEVKDYSTAASSNLSYFKTYFKGMLEQGIYLAPSQFEAGFMSMAHTYEDLDKTIEAGRRALEIVSQSR